LGRIGLQARPVAQSTEFDGLQITRTDGQHGVGEVARNLAPVSGFVVGGVYIAGDTIWCEEVDQAIQHHKPSVVVVNGGGARFVDSEPIVMTVSDISEVLARVQTVVVVHLEAINHCFDSRELVRSRVPDAIVPDDGEAVDL
jgi:hypothetical protein